MKKFLLLTLGLGVFTVSCGTKESSMQNKSSDSTSVQSTTPTPPAKADTVKVDSTAMPATR